MSLFTRNQSVTPKLSRALQPASWPDVTSQRRDELQPASDALRPSGPGKAETPASVLALMESSTRSTPSTETDRTALRSSLQPNAQTDALRDVGRPARSDAVPWPFAANRAERPSAPHPSSATARTRPAATSTPFSTVDRSQAAAVPEAESATSPVEIQQHNTINMHLDSSELFDQLDTRLRDLAAQLTARMDDQIARVQFHNTLIGP